MNAFFLTQSVQLKTDIFYRFYEAAPDTEKVSKKDIYLNLSGELRLIQEHLIKEGKDRSAFLIEEDVLLQFETWPQRLGRLSNINKKLTLNEDLAEPLLDQLKQLKLTNPNKKIFRIAIVNGFGGNLGDTLVGLTAFRCVLPILKKYLINFSIDILYGIDSNKFNENLLVKEDYIERVLYQTINIQEFENYDAYFDTSALVRSPKFSELPICDWYLWWFGVNPSTFKANKKRNKINLNEARFFEFKKKLSCNKKIVFFNAQASVSLRSLPLNLAESLLRKIININSDIIVLAQPELSIDHERIVNLSSIVKNTEEFIMALALSDAVITVDTFSLHLADALELPTLAFFATLPKENYPYYPKMTGVNIPNIDKLPAYLKVKIEDNQVVENYHSVWQEAKVDYIIEEFISTNLNFKSNKKINFYEEELNKKFFLVETNFGLEFKYIEYHEAYIEFQERLCELLQEIIKPGQIVIASGIGYLKLAQNIGFALRNSGKLIVIEHRDAFSKIIYANLLNKGILNLEVVSSILKDNEETLVPELNPWFPFKAHAWGNEKSRVKKVETLTIDSLLKEEASGVNVIILQPPFILREIVTGALNEICKNKPIIISGPLGDSEKSLMVSKLSSLGYKCLGILIKGNSGDYYGMIAVHKTTNLNADGFINL